MTGEQKQEYLLAYEKYQVRSNRLSEQMCEIQSFKTDLEVIRPILLSGSYSDWLNCIKQCDSFLRQTVKEYKRAVEMYTEVYQQIEQMNEGSEIEKEILICRYIRGNTWEQIAEHLSYSITNIHRLHKKALEHFEPIQC